MATVKVTSPKGTLEWVTITGEGKENLSGTLQYLANLVLDPKDAAVKKFIASMDEFWAENRPKGVKEPKSMGYYDHTERSDDTDEEGDPIYVPTGLLQLTFKTGTTYISGDTKVIKTYNSKAKEVQLGDLKIGNGSVGQISGAMGIYLVKSKAGKVIDAGVTLYLDAIKISKLVEFSQDAGFEADDDDGDEGFTGEDGWVEPEEQTAKPRL